MKLYIGVTNDNELYFIDWDKCDNEQRKTFTLCGGTYGNPKTETEGREEARKSLSSSDYWEELGYYDSSNPLLNCIDFEKKAEEVLNVDGWENINGEYTHFGEVENKEIYLNSCSGGQHQEKGEDIKELWISETDFKKINALWDKEHLKPLNKKSLKYMSSIFEKYKSLCNDEEALIKFLKCIKWRQ